MRFVRTVSTITAALLVGAALGARIAPSGRSAERVSSVGAAFGFGRRVLRRALDDGLLSVAAAIAFYALSSLVPALSVLISVYGLVTTPAEIPAQLAALRLPIPAEVRGLVLDQAGRIASTSTATLSVTLATSVGVALWSAAAAVKAMVEGLDRMWEVRETRSFGRLTLVTSSFTVVAVLTIAATLAALALLPGALAPIGDRAGAVVSALGWPALFGLGWTAVFLLYRRGPNRRPPAGVLQMPGALFATLAWVATSAGFSWYAATLGRYSATYGSLAGVVVVLTWNWLSSIIVLLGGAVTAELERRAAGRDDRPGTARAGRPGGGA